MLRSYIIASLLIPWTALMASLAGLSSLISQSASTFFMRGWAAGWLKMAGVKLDISGLDQVDPKVPSIYMANHVSIIDIPILIWALPVDLRFIFKQSIMWVPIVGIAIYTMGMIPINRTNRQKAKHSLKKAGERIRGGSHVLIFPEGTRSEDETLLPFKKGGFFLALQEHIDIIPVTILNSREFCGRNSFVTTAGTVQVKIHERNKMADYDVADRTTIIKTVRGVIESSLPGTVKS